VLAERLPDDREERRRRGQVEQPVERDPGLRVEAVHDRPELLVALRVVERRRHVAHPVDERRQHALVGLPARELLDRLARLLAEAVVADVTARQPDQVEALRQGPLVREVVDGREELPLGQVPGRAEDGQRGGMDGEAFQAFRQGIWLLGGCCGHLVSSAQSAEGSAALCALPTHFACCTACPPN
jgi:hypothetical protein